MNESELVKKAKIRPWSTILISKNILCDGFQISDEFEDHGLCFFSHIHDDHTQGFESALGKCDFVCVSNISKELFIALKGDWLKKRKNFIALDYGTSFNYKDDKITLFETEHILGSSQILVEDSSGTRIVYSGDFNMPDTKSIECDLLILDSVHGSPTYNTKSNFDQKIKDLGMLVKNELKQGKWVIVRSYRGKLQKLMHHLRKKIEKPVPFVASNTDCRLADVYGHYNLGTKDLMNLEDEEFQEISRSQDVPYILFTESGGPLLAREGTEIMSIRVGSSHEATTDFWKHIDLSDHATFKEILDYVKGCNPKVVITDNSVRTRTGLAGSLASEITKNLGITSIPSSPLTQIQNK